MTNAERERLKVSLRAMAAGRGDGIDLDTQFRWVVEGIKEPETFFDSLPSLIPSDAILYFEGGSIAPDIATFYEGHRAQNAVAVVRDTIFPVPNIYHVTFSSQVAAQLREWAASRPSQELFDHVKAYRGESLLFTFHDAFDRARRDTAAQEKGALRIETSGGSSLLISDHIAEPLVAEFCRSLDASYHQEPNASKRDPEQLRWFLKALENPHKIRFAGESWWRRLWRRWARR